MLKLLPSRSKVEKDWVAHANGSEPERSLSLSRIFVSPTNSPSSLGTLPVSALLSSRRSDRVVSNRISAGIGPAKPVFWDLNLVTSPELHVTLLEEHAAPMAPPESVSIVFHVVSAAVNMESNASAVPSRRRSVSTGRGGSSLAAAARQAIPSRSVAPFRKPRRAPPLLPLRARMSGNVERLGAR